MRTRLLPALVLAGLVTPAAAELKVSDPWARATVAAQRSSGAFMRLQSDEPAALVSASSPAAKVVEIHEMRMEKDVMRMRAVPRLPLPAGKTVELKPGGYHIMLMELTRPLTKGERVPITLRVEGKDRAITEVQVEAEVRDLTSAGHRQH